MRYLTLLALVLLLAPGCTFLKTYRHDAAAVDTPREAAARPSSELVRFVVDNPEGARTTLEDRELGTLSVTVGPRYHSAGGDPCIRAYLGGPQDAQEPIAICNKKTGWTIAPRIMSGN